MVLKEKSITNSQTIVLIEITSNKFSIRYTLLQHQIFFNLIIFQLVKIIYLKLLMYRIKKTD